MQGDSTTPVRLKRCTKCSVERDLDQFHDSRMTRDGKNFWCKLCKADYFQKHHVKKRFSAPEGMKRCATCHEIKPLGEFYPVGPQQRKRLGGGYEDGLEYRCKPCLLKRSKDRAEKLKNSPRQLSELKTCSTCQETKPRSCFGLNRLYSDWLAPICDECQAIKRASLPKRKYLRSYYYVRKHGVTAEEFGYMLQAQDYLCAICGLKLDLDAKKGSVDKACLDHCHSTGKLRAALCVTCNWKVGYLEAESPDWREKALAYLDRHK